MTLGEDMQGLSRQERAAAYRQQILADLVALQSAAVRHEDHQPGDAGRAMRALIDRRLAELGVPGLPDDLDSEEREFLDDQSWQAPWSIAAFMSIVGRAARR